MNLQNGVSSGKRKFLRTGIASVVVVFCLLVASRPSYGQLLDSGLIISILESISRTISGSIIPVMKAMNATTGSMMSYQQNTIYPRSGITSIESLAGVNLGYMGSIQSRFATPLNSATLPNTRSLEGLLLSGNANNIGNIRTSYSNVYEALPSSTSLEPGLRTATDATDAQAMDAYKKAVQLDAIANTEIVLAKQYMQQLQNTAPGNAALVMAQAAAWNLQASAYTQQGLDELLRTEASETAYSSFSVKAAAAEHQRALQHLGFSPAN